MFWQIVSKEIAQYHQIIAWFNCIVGLVQWFSTWGLWTIFGRVTSRYFMYRAVLHLLYSSFRWGLLG